MFIASRIHVIKDGEGLPTVSGEMLEKLDEMLTLYGVEHFFSLPPAGDDGFVIDEEEVARIYYDGDDNTKFNLVYALWSKVVRGVSDERIEKGIKRWAERL